MFIVENKTSYTRLNGTLIRMILFAGQQWHDRERGTSRFSEGSARIGEKGLYNMC